MAYTINKTNGAVFATVTDGTIDTSSSVTLIGKNFTNYGERMNENFIRLLENSAGDNPPDSPLIGQLWFNTSTATANGIAPGSLGVYNGTQFKPLGSGATGAEPSTPSEGEQWYDPATEQLKIYNGTEWLIVGPTYSSGNVSGAVVETILDDQTVPVEHVVVSLYANNDRVAIINNNSAFTPGPTIQGFATIETGFQFSSIIPDAMLHGTASNADKLDNLESAQFLRSDVNATTTGTLAVSNDTGLSVGTDSDFNVAISTTHAILSNTTTDGDIRLNVNVGGTPTDSMVVDGATGRVSLSSDPVSAMEIATKQYVDSNVSGGGGGTVDTTVAVIQLNTDVVGAPVENCGIEVTRGSEPSKSLLWDETSDVWTVGTETFVAGTFDGVATSAQYADLAERFEADDEYEAGTVMILGGDAEVTMCNDELSNDVFGVVSTDPAYLMNNASDGVAIALKGRVPVKVFGTAKKGDRLVAGGNGVARVGKPDELNWMNVIGRVIEDKDDVGVAVIEAFVDVK